MTAPVLALDLEATLISNASSQIPRPGLYSFLEFCEERFERLLLFTCVEKEDAWPMLRELSREDQIPRSLLRRLEYVHWTGRYKDLNFILDCQPQQVRLVDDDEYWIKPEQLKRWIPITPWHGTDQHDGELLRVRRLLEDWLRQK